MRTPLIIAHRGDSTRGLENSLEAVRLALSVPVDMIEIDLRLSADGSLVVMHDRQTGRTSGRNIDIERSSMEEITSIRLRNGEAVPVLPDVLKLVSGRAGVNIEIKSDRAGSSLAAYLRENRFAGPLLVSSFKEGEVRAVREAMPEVPCAVIFDAFSLRHVEEYRRKGYPAISLRKNTVTEPLVRAFHSRGVQVLVWTVDAEEEMRRCIDWKADGIYTNRPSALKELLDKQRTSGV